MRIGIDLGGTKIEGIALDAQGREVRRKRIPTPRHDYHATIKAIVHLVQELEGDVPATVGIGIPGAVSPASGLIKNANSTWLIDRPLHHDLARALGREVRVANDANCFAVSEATDGAARGARVVFGVIIGTGTGGGIAIEGQALQGRHAIAGEWGHNPLPWAGEDERPGPACYCGKRGCIETFLSGPGFASFYTAQGGEETDAETIVQRAAAGEPLARSCLKRYEDRLARALASVINILDPDVIVLGGGMSHITSIYESVPNLWGRYVFSDTVTTPLRQARYGASSGVRGAAWLWPAD